MIFVVVASQVTVFQNTVESISEKQTIVKFMIKH